MSADKEIVAIVDEKNTVVGQTSRTEMRVHGLIHRATYILVFNGKGELFIQKRTPTKDIYPGYYDVAAGGVVLAEEDYEESAKRELFEELGINSDKLKYHFDHFHADDTNKVWGRIFSCVHDGPMVLQEEEVESGIFLDPHEVLKMCDKQPFTPDGIEILQRYLAEQNQ